MSETKLSSDEVPEKFAEWLLSMGCPIEKVPTRDKITELCRGQYYVVWRSMMERVHPKDIVRHKRMQVFCDDIHKCNNQIILNQNDTTIEPEELALWKQHQQLKNKVENQKAYVTRARHSLDVLQNKVEEKVAERNLMSTSVDNTQRRAYLLQRLTQELTTQRDKLRETSGIANDICSFSEDNATDIQYKLDKYINSTELSHRQPDRLSNSIVALNGYHVTEPLEQQRALLVRCAGNELCSQLYARRGALLRALNAHGDTLNNPTGGTRISLQEKMEALNSIITLKTFKNRVLIDKAHEKLVHAITKLNNELSSKECELLVLRCERTRCESRVMTLRMLVDELSQMCASAVDRTTVTVTAVDGAIEKKREELEKVSVSLNATVSKIQNIKESLKYVFRWMQESSDTNRYRVVQLGLPQESMSSLREFYESRREARRQRVDLSLELDDFDQSMRGTTENPQYRDELKFYLSNFSLENNRQLILESGEKKWIFTTVDAAIQRFHKKCIDDSLYCSLLSPCNSLSLSVKSLTDMVHKKAQLEEMIMRLGVAYKSMQNIHIDIKPQVEEEARIIDNVKKRLKDNLIFTENVNKTIKTSQDNLTFWSENKLRTYISPDRLVNGLGYKAYETWYLDNIKCEK